MNLPETIKMIAIDLDGTLLNSKSKIALKNKKMLNKCVAEGYKTIIATGRNYNTAKNLTKDIPGLIYITSNGGNIVGADGELLLNSPIPNKKSISLIKLLEQEEKITYSIYISDYIIVDNKYKYLKTLFLSEDKSWLQLFSLKKLVKLTNNLQVMSIKEVKKASEFIQDNNLDIQKMFIMGDNTVLDSIKERIETEFEEIQLSSSGKNNLEVNSKDVSKGMALEFLADKWNISVREAIAFGDSRNDLEIFNTVGMSIVMENSSCSKLRDKADFVAPANDENGVAKVLSKL